MIEADPKSNFARKPSSSFLWAKPLMRGVKKAFARIVALSTSSSVLLLGTAAMTACAAPGGARDVGTEQAAGPSPANAPWGPTPLDPANVAWRGGTTRFAQACADWDDWDKPAPPFQVLGDTFYVGTCGITALLIVSPEGHALIDSGTVAGADAVLANIRALGFDPSDVKYVLHSHEHFDHVGGHAAIVAATGAEVVASAEAAAVLTRGQVGPGDPQAGIHDPMQPVAVDRLVGDGDTLQVAERTLTAHATPGHSPGALSWTWTACTLPGEPPVCRRIAYVDSLSPVSADGYRFADHPAYLAAYRAGIAKVAALGCDILLTPHPSASDMIARLGNGKWEDQAACRNYADDIADRLDARLSEEEDG